MIQYEYHPAPSLFCEKWCPQFTKNREQKNTQHYCARHVFPYVGIIQIRFQVKTNQVYSQPIYLSSLFRQYHIAFILFCKVLIVQRKCILHLAFFCSFCIFLFCIFLYFCLCHLFDILFFQAQIYTFPKNSVYH